MTNKKNVMNWGKCKYFLEQTTKKSFKNSFGSLKKFGTKNL